jgi:hypothetical protein
LHNDKKLQTQYKIYDHEICEKLLLSQGSLERNLRNIEEKINARNRLISFTRRKMVEVNLKQKEYEAPIKE